MDPMNRSSSSAALLVGAVAVPIAVCAVLSALIDVFVAPAAALVLVLVIVIVCLRGSWLVDVLVIVVSAIGFDFFLTLSLIHISEPTRLGMISYAVFCLKKKKK